MPNRVIKESIKSSAQIDSLTWFEEVVFYRLMVSADDYGCYDGRPIYLKNALFPTKDNVTKKAIEDAIQRLVSVGLLLKYEVSGMPYLFFPSWEKHQRVRNKKRKYPAPPDDVLLTANCGQMTAICHSESESESNPNTKENGGQAAKRFTPPTVQDVEAYIQERKSNVDAQRFVDFYASKGWMVGKNTMKDWRAAVRTWEQRDGTQAQAQTIASSTPDAGELERMRKLRDRMRAGA